MILLILFQLSIMHIHVPFKISLLFLLLSVPDLGRCQFHGHFNFIGFVDYPYPEVTNQIIVKSRLKCSSICLENKDCYYYDYCEAESSTSCFLHDQHVSASILVTAGACKRYKLVNTFLSNWTCTIFLYAIIFYYLFFSSRKDGMVFLVVLVFF